MPLRPALPLAASSFRSSPFSSYAHGRRRHRSGAAARVRRPAQGKDHQGQHLPPAQPQPAFQPEQHGPFSGPVLVEIGQNRTLPEHISESLDFRRGKLWPNGRPGLGVTLNMERLTLVTAITEPGANRTIYFRPDGSQTSW